MIGNCWTMRPLLCRMILPRCRFPRKTLPPRKNFPAQNWLSRTRTAPRLIVGFPQTSHIMWKRCPRGHTHTYPRQHADPEPYSAAHAEHDPSADIRTRCTHCNTCTTADYSQNWRQLPLGVAAGDCGNLSCRAGCSGLQERPPQRYCTP